MRFIVSPACGFCCMLRALLVISDMRVKSRYEALAALLFGEHPASKFYAKSYAWYRLFEVDLWFIPILCQVESFRTYSGWTTSLASGYFGRCELQTCPLCCFLPLLFASAKPYDVESTRYRCIILLCAARHERVRSSPFCLGRSNFNFATSAAL